MIDPKSGELANSSCPQTVQEYFIAGSEPTEVCGGQVAGSPSNWLSHLFGKGSNPPPPPNAAANQPGQRPKPGAKPGSRQRAGPARRPRRRKEKGASGQDFWYLWVKQKACGQPETSAVGLGRGKRSRAMSRLTLFAIPLVFVVACPAFAQQTPTKVSDTATNSSSATSANSAPAPRPFSSLSPREALKCAQTS